MSTHYLLRLSSVDTFQLLDALSLRTEKWERRINEDTENAQEARKIATHYRQIISSNEKQIKEQGRIQ